MDGRIVWALVLLTCVQGIEHNLPDNVELVDPADLGLDGQIDLDKLLGNVKALPIDTNALSSALGKPGLKTQVLTVGFDGSEGLNLDDFELPQMKNDEHAPLAQEAFKSFKNFFKNSSSATPVANVDVGEVPTAAQSQRPPELQQVVRTVNGKRRTMMKRRKVIRANATTTTPLPPQAPSTGPKVIELDSSQIEKLIASGKIGPPKSLTPGGPQVIELGQSDLDALLNGENGDEIKQILEGGDTLKDFDIGQLRATTPADPTTQYQPAPVEETTTSVATTSRIVESSPPVSVAQVLTQVSSPVPPSSEEEETFPETTIPVSPVSPVTTPEVTVPSTTTPTTTTGLPIIYQYSSANEERRANNFPSQASIPLQFYTSHANGQQVAKQIKTPTFEFISAPPVSFSSSILPNKVIQQEPQQQPYFFQPQNTFGLPSSFIRQSQPQFVVGPSLQQPSPIKSDSSNNISPVPQISANTEQIKPSVSENSIPISNFVDNLHKVNLPQNAIKLVTPSPQSVQSVLNQVPPSFQHSIVPNHVVNSPVLDPVRLNQNSFIRSQPQQPQEPFRNTQLFTPISGGVSSSSSSPQRPPSSFRFPTTSSILGNAPNRFRTAESSNPFYQNPGGFGNLILNSFVAGDGLNYRPRSQDTYQSPGI